MKFGTHQQSQAKLEEDDRLLCGPWLTIGYDGPSPGNRPVRANPPSQKEDHDLQTESRLVGGSQAGRGV